MIRRAHVIYALTLPISWASLLDFEGLVLGAVILGFWAIVFYSPTRPKVLGILLGLAFIGNCLLGLYPSGIVRRPTSRATQCLGNIKNIALALRAYHAEYGYFPPAYIAEENGKPLLSWRVLILPYLARRRYIEPSTL